MDVTKNSAGPRFNEFSAPQNLVDQQTSGGRTFFTFCKARAPDETRRNLLNEKETATYLAVSRSFLAKSRMNGTLEGHTTGPPYHRIGRAIRYSIADLEKWLENNRHEAR